MHDRLSRLPHLPALDGLRGLAVAAVFCFHAGSSWMPGGFLGVSVFFTLSGFLITRLLVTEAERTQRIDLPAFWVRRLRRLLPAALVTIGFVLLLGATALAVAPETLRADAIAALLDVANWRFLASGQSYASLFATPSPLLHFWSLAIEEQFYVLFPIMVLLVARAARGRRPLVPLLRVVFSIAIVASVLTTLIAARAGNADFVYYSLPTRAAELLAGALLATYTTPRAFGRRSAGLVIAVTGFGALAVVGALCATTTRDDSWISGGGLSAFSVLSIVLVAAALPTGAFGRMLSITPLRALGRISYGVYLFHWPVILWLTAARVGVDGWELMSLQVAVTLAIATASYVIVEQPVRQGRLPRGRAARATAPIAVAAMLSLTLWTTAQLTAPPTTDLAAAQQSLRELTAAPTRTGPPSQETSVVASLVDARAAVPPRVAFYGDSTALVSALGVLQWGTQTGSMVGLRGSTGFGCGVLRDGEVRDPIDHTVGPARWTCGDWATEWADNIAAAPPDIAVIQVGPFEVASHRFTGDAEWRSIGDPAFDARLETDMLDAVDLFAIRSIQVVWLTSPVIDVDAAKVPRPSSPSPESDPARMARFNEILASVARQRPALRVVDLAGWLRQQPGGELDPGLRPDGTHFTTESAAVVAQWLGPAILRTAGRSGGALPASR